VGEPRSSATEWAVIFDCDGVLVDSEPLSLRVLQAVLRQYQLPTEAHKLREYCGHSDQDTYRDLVSRFGLFVEQERFLADIISAYKQIIRDEGLRVFPGVRPLIESLSKQRVCYALGSSGPKAKIEASLNATGLNQAFLVTVSSDDVAQPKPAPDIFMACARLLNIHPARCIVIEDSPTGVQAATQAGMACVAVTNTFPRSMLDGADLVVDDLSELSVGILGDLVSAARYGARSK
jgi:HAD superfamily hydrolase (TIGR01509 family)